MEKRESAWLRGALGLSENETPFPWQQELLELFADGKIKPALDIPTGLGKTSVMAIWLVARALGADLPRRLAYVVDRRAVVDQATDVATRLREYVDSQEDFKRSLGLDNRQLPISTLRGQHADNREWLEDPAAPAIIVGTVDMIGSRLLFEGYGTSRKMRPYQAGLLGTDTLAVLDEAHLVPPFEKLLRQIASNTDSFGPRDEASRELVPRFRLLTLSATARPNGGDSFGLADADFEHSVVQRRLDAKKLLSLKPLSKDEQLTDVLAKQAWTHIARDKAVRVIVFCNKPKDAEKTEQSLKKLAKGDKKQGIPATEVATELFVGGRRIYERGKAAVWLQKHGFLDQKAIKPPKQKHPTQRPLEYDSRVDNEVKDGAPAFVFATSAGEVGVDMDADHMVCDLVAWERMVQRLGRVNRRGGRISNIVVVHEEPADQNADERLKAIKTLPRNNGFFDASTGAIRLLKERAKSDSGLKATLEAATTPPPRQPELSRALIDAWSMTSLEDHTGRPSVQPWLRGWTDDPPQTTVIWRKHLPVRIKGRSSTKKEIKDYFEAAPPHLSEKLETETDNAVKWLFDRAKALNAPQDDPAISPDDTAAIALSNSGEVRGVFRLKDLKLPGDPKLKKTRRDEISRTLVGSTLVVDARVAGLRNGRLETTATDPPRTADDGEEWIATENQEPVIRFRVRKTDDTAVDPASEPRWQPCFRFAAELSDDGEGQEWLIVDKWRHDSSNEDSRSVGTQKQLLEEHQQWAEERIRKIAEKLEIPQDYTEMLAVAARIHDRGKQSRRWQRAFNAPADDIYAKTRGPIQQSVLGGYRHEFGSFLAAKRNGAFAELSDDLRDLALHLIAAHHGFARPLIRVDGCDDLPPSALEKQATDVVLRFARLQKRWGPWGLAWWESLLRAADQQASRSNEKNDPTAIKENRDD